MDLGRIARSYRDNRGAVGVLGYSDPLAKYARARGPLGLGGVSIDVEAARRDARAMGGARGARFMAMINRRLDKVAMGGREVNGHVIVSGRQGRSLGRNWKHTAGLTEADRWLSQYTDFKSTREGNRWYINTRAARRDLRKALKQDPRLSAKERRAALKALDKTIRAWSRTKLTGSKRSALTGRLYLGTMKDVVRAKGVRTYGRWGTEHYTTVTREWVKSAQWDSYRNLERASRAAASRDRAAARAVGQLARKSYRHSPSTYSVIADARAQSPGRHVLRIDPSKSPRDGIHEELSRMEAHGLAQRDGRSSWRLDPALRYTKRPPAPAMPTGVRDALSRAAGPSRGWAAQRVTDDQQLMLQDWSRANPETVRVDQLGRVWVRPSAARRAVQLDRESAIRQGVHRAGVWGAEHADHRMSHALAFGTPKGGEVVYTPSLDSSGRGAQMSRYLSQRAKDTRFVKSRPDGSFSIRSKDATRAIRANAKASAEVLARDGGEAGKHVDVSRLFKGASVERGRYVLAVRNAPDSDKAIWRLQRAMENGEVRLDSPGRFSMTRATAQKIGVEKRPIIVRDSKVSPAKQTVPHRREPPELSKETLSISRESAADLAAKHEGLSARLPELKDPALSPDTRIVGGRRSSDGRTLQPLKSPDELSDGSRKKIASISHRIRDIPQEGRALWLHDRSARARGTWWSEHAVVRREMRAYEVAARKAGDKETASRMFELRQYVERMQYSELRDGRSRPRPPVAQRAGYNDTVYEALLSRAGEKGDGTRDYLVFARETGARPHEIQKGIQIEKVEGNSVTVRVDGSKKYNGLDAGPARYRADRGADRVLTIESETLADAARRAGDRYEPPASQEAMRMRVKRVREGVEGAEKWSPYVFRHNARTEAEIRGDSKDEIARKMGHQSTRSQEAYGKK